MTRLTAKVKTSLELRSVHLSLAKINGRECSKDGV